MQVTYSQIRKAQPGPYPMRLAREDAAVVILVVNQGIDSYLEACNCPERGDRYETSYNEIIKPNRKFPRGAGFTHLDCTISSESLPTLLRRLAELGNRGGPDGGVEDRAHTLVGDMLGTLGFNADGCDLEIVPDAEAAALAEDV